MQAARLHGTHLPHGLRSIHWSYSCSTSKLTVTDPGRPLRLFHYSALAAPDSLEMHSNHLDARQQWPCRQPSGMGHAYYLRSWRTHETCRPSADAIQSVGIRPFQAAGWRGARSLGARAQIACRLRIHSQCREVVWSPDPCVPPRDMERARCVHACRSHAPLLAWCQ